MALNTVKCNRLTPLGLKVFYCGFDSAAVLDFSYIYVNISKSIREKSRYRSPNGRCLVHQVTPIATPHAVFGDLYI